MFVFYVLAFALSNCDNVCKDIKNATNRQKKSRKYYENGQYFNESLLFCPAKLARKLRFQGQNSMGYG